MDPYYTPVQVDSYIQKCESTRSILEHLTFHVDGTPLALSANELSQKSESFSSKRAVYSHSYVLQLPPLKTHSSNLTYQSPITSPPHQAYSSMLAVNNSKVQDSPDTSYRYTKRHVECLNKLFDGKQHHNNHYTIPSDDTSTANGQDSEYDLDSLILNELEDSETDSLSDITQDDCIMLTFPPGENSDSLVTKTNEAAKEEHMQEHLAESNLTINPHHFDPL